MAQTTAGGDTWWAATGRGLFRWRTGEGHWTLEGDLDGPGESFITALVIHPTSGALWVAADMGLWFWNGVQWISHAPPPESRSVELPLRALTAGDGDWLWMADAQGVVCYNSRTGETGERFTPFNSGLGSRRVVALLQHAGCLWIVTHAGISRVEL
jgi:ligand-binding sensor domain-containing protein